MTITPKYDIGQILYEIRLKKVADTERCECCGQLIYHSEWRVDYTEQEIHNVGSRDGKIFYRVYRPCVYTEHLPETKIGECYFTSIKEAQEACDRLNAERKGVEKKKRPKHPIQPTYYDKNGVLRFKPNGIIRWLLNNDKFSLNEIAAMPFEDNDREQLAQLIGYSLGGFSELSYVSDELYEKVKKQIPAWTEEKPNA